jgi:murein DD-endopeptidase MepM/ murein hydrolase activator NlpD
MICKIFKCLKHLFLFLISAISLTLNAQPNIEIIPSETQNGYTLFVNNEEYCPVSVHLSLKLKNLQSTNGNNKVFVIPARANNFRITDLVVIKPNRGFSFNSSSVMNFGDSEQEDYDYDFEYFLPFAEGKTYCVGQGYNGSKTHKGENALDFDMSIGEEVCAARSGVVVEVVEYNYKHCPSKECLQYNNYILIYHDDGTFAEYTHIKKEGSLVEIGDQVEIGQIIALSGNVGFSSGPHLHFSVFLGHLKEKKTLETKFLTGNGQNSEYLVERKNYLRDY